MVCPFDGCATDEAGGGWVISGLATFGGGALYTGLLGEDGIVRVTPPVSISPYIFTFASAGGVLIKKDTVEFG